MTFYHSTWCRSLETSGVNGSADFNGGSLFQRILRPLDDSIVRIGQSKARRSHCWEPLSVSVDEGCPAP